MTDQKTDLNVSADYLETLFVAYGDKASADDIVLQLENEQSLKQRTYDKAIKQHDKSAKAGAYSDTKAGRWATQHLVQSLTSRLDEVEETLSSQRGVRNIFIKLFECRLSNDQVAYLTIKQAIDSVVMTLAKAGTKSTFDRDWNHGIPAATLEIACVNRIWEEVRLAWLQENAFWSYKNVMSQITEGGLSRTRAMKAVQRREMHHGIEWDDWRPSQTEKVQIGMHLINYLIESTGIIRRVDNSKNPMLDHKSKSKAYYEIDPEFAKRLFEAEDTLSLRETRHEPMVVPPLPWSADNLVSGPYLHPMTPPVSFTKRLRANTIGEFTNVENHDVLLDTVNSIQDTSYMVNEFVLDAVQWAMDHEENLGGLPQEEEYAYEPWLPEYANDSQAKLAWRDQYTRTQRLNDKRMSQMFALRSTLASADRFKGRPLWFPVQLDARGRAYPMSTFGLSPQGSGYQKALLKSYESRPILTEADRNSLYFQCATEGEHDGIDKASTAARIKWVEDNLQTILEIGEDFRSHVHFWADAGSPWMFLAACREIYEFHQHGYGYESRLFCYQDATCSGLQVFSALGRDEVGGFATNLVPGHARQDIYGLVAERAMETLRSMDISSHDRKQREIHKIVVERGLDRSATKRQVMTRPYNAKLRSCVDYTHEWYKLQVVNGSVVLPDDNSFNAFHIAQYVAPIIWEAIVSAIPAANEMMVYIEDCIKLTVKANPSAPIQWSLPDGMVCIIDKQDQRAEMIQTRINSVMHKRRIMQDDGRQSTRQHGNAGPPNFIHSLDALHLRETARLWEDKCAAQGRKPIYTFVHDSFAVPAADMPEFSRTIREAFVKIHSEWDLMGSLVESLQEIAGPDVVFPERPSTGDLDINGVLTSEFFFS